MKKIAQGLQLNEAAIRYSLQTNITKIAGVWTHLMWRKCSPKNCYSPPEEWIFFKYVTHLEQREKAQLDYLAFTNGNFANDNV